LRIEKLFVQILYVSNKNKMHLCLKEIGIRKNLLFDKI